MCYNYFRNEGERVMAKKKKKKYGLNVKGRLFLAFIVFGAIISALSYNFFYNVKSINEMKDKKKILEEKLVKLNEEEKALKSDIQKLEDPTYIARYAREKYLYSKDGELIIRLPDEVD